ncbi:MAG: class I SAM-dependent methyltransferase [Shinella sp.]|nr:class I SAM-dependent methyltransferase [Shinella sp.]
MPSNLRKFIFHDVQKIEGYIDPPDALVFLALLECQKANDLIGGIAEIGVFYGRSYFLLRKIVEPEKDVLAIDLFDLGKNRNGVSDQYRRFLENGRRLGLPVDESRVIIGDSTKLAAKTIVDKIGRIRFFSIDGGHALSTVASDSLLAQSTLADHGIIAFDDTFNPAWPEVTVGVADFLRDRTPMYTVFCVTKYKTYICKSQFHDLYRTAIAQAPQLKVFAQSEVRFLGADATRLHDPLLRRLFYEAAKHTGLGALSEIAYR